MRNFGSTLAVMALLFVSAHPSHAQQDRSRLYSPREQLRHYALSTCLSYAFPNSEAGKDAADAAAGYTELGSAPLEAYTEVARLSQAFVKRTYFSIASTQLQTMKCIDLYHSPELAHLIQKYVGSVARNQRRHPSSSSKRGRHVAVLHKLSHSAS